MDASINWTEKAESDLKSIFDFIANNSKYYANKQVSKIYLKVQILKTHIFIGRIVPEMQLEYIRELIEGNYRIIYMIISPIKIDILHIVHTSRDFSNIELL